MLVETTQNSLFVVSPVEFTSSAFPMEVAIIVNYRRKVDEEGRSTVPRSHNLALIGDLLQDDLPLVS